jgi:hypothetical protein
VRGLVLAVVVVIGACGTSGARGPGIDVDRALTTVRYLAEKIGVRSRDTPESVRAAGWLQLELAAAGISVETQVVGTVELPEIRVAGGLFREAHTKVVRDPNLITRFGSGDGPALLFMAHYDTVPTSPGAIDNAVGVAVLLELARILQAEPPPQPVMIVFTAAEEVGLVGAEALAAEVADRTSVAIALDLIGGDGELVVNGAGHLIGRVELQWLADAADRAGVSIGVPAAHRVVSRWWPQAERSDHGPFTRRGTRAIHLYHRGHDGEWIDRAYHSERDTPARVRRESVDEIGRMLRALVASPPPTHGGDGFWVPFVDGVVIPRIALVVFEILVALGALAALLFSRVGLLAWLARNRDEKTGPGVLIGVLCYLGAAAIAFGIERATSGGHPALWLHEPLRAVVGMGCLLLGTFGLLTRGVARVAPWRGEGRYLAFAALVPLAIGSAWLALGAAEIAWVWLVPALAIALAPLAPLATNASSWRRAVGRIVVVAAVVTSALPVVLVLHPDRLREAAWNGFLPAQVPGAAAVGLFGIPVLASVAWALRRRGAAGPTGTLVLGLGCGLLVVIGLVVAVTAPAHCTPVEFGQFLLA